MADEQPGRVVGKMGRDVTRAKFWVEVEGEAENVALVLERLAGVVASSVDRPPDDLAGDNQPVGVPSAGSRPQVDFDG